MEMRAVADSEATVETGIGGRNGNEMVVELFFKFPTGGSEGGAFCDC